MLARAMLETAAMTNYVCELGEPLIKLKRWDRAWEEVFQRASIGSFFLKEHAPTFRGQHILPLNVGKAIDSLASIVPEGMRADYSYLSEIAHPNCFALMRYVDMDEIRATFRRNRPFNFSDFDPAIHIIVPTAVLAYNRIFLLAQMKTALKQLARITHRFLEGHNSMSKQATAP